MFFLDAVCKEMKVQNTARIVKSFHSLPLHGILLSLGDYIMKLLSFLRPLRCPPILLEKTGPLQCRLFQSAFVPRDLEIKPKRFKYPAFYDPYGPKPPPTDKIVKLVELIVALPPEERKQIGPALRERLRQVLLQEISSDGMCLGPQAAASASLAKTEETTQEKTIVVTLEKVDAAVKIKAIKEVRASTSLGLGANDLIDKDASAA
ncbi:hypothetical protein Sjap_021674 [Stephania japonica]|uniref:Uncharacterized protein n=1 Tax=Stephania japonica TaxID=461633 RepID=A0AAP0HT20_9MAGN